MCALSWLSCSVMILMNDLQVAACRARGDAMLHQTAVLVIMIMMMMRCGGGGVCCGENLLTPDVLRIEKGGVAHIFASHNKPLAVSNHQVGPIWGCVPLCGIRAPRTTKE